MMECCACAVQTEEKNTLFVTYKLLVKWRHFRWEEGQITLACFLKVQAVKTQYIKFQRLNVTSAIKQPVSDIISPDSTECQEQYEKHC